MRMDDGCASRIYLRTDEPGKFSSDSRDAKSDLWFDEDIKKAGECSPANSIKLIENSSKGLLAQRVGLSGRDLLRRKLFVLHAVRRT